MQLTYETTEKGYTILNDGTPWIVQDDYIPYPGATMAESAQNHIDAIIEDANRPTPPSPEDEIATLKQQLADTEKRMDEAIVELTLAMTMGGMPNV